MTVSRRSLLTAMAVLAPFTKGCSVAAGGANVETESSAGTLLRSAARLPAPFSVPLPIPPVLGPNGAGRYEITQRAADVEILPGLRTTVWGYNGIFPGPTIESRRGTQTVVRHTNQLDVPVVVHLHGGRTPAEHDGYPTDHVRPGDTSRVVEACARSSSARVSVWLVSRTARSGQGPCRERAVQGVERPQRHVQDTADAANVPFATQAPPTPHLTATPDP